MSVKTPVFPFARFPGVDVVLGPEMKSTGEVMGIDRNFARAYAKAQVGAGIHLPVKGTCFISVKDRDKAASILLGLQLINLGFDLVATTGTAAALQSAGVPVRRVNKVYEGQPHVVDALINGDVQMMINTTAPGAQMLSDSLQPKRRTALDAGNPELHDDTRRAAPQSRPLPHCKAGSLEVCPIQAYASNILKHVA
jgi:carbamoyl-phosphate synthase large subunit